MILHIAMRYSFSSEAGHRSRAVRIALSLALSLAMLLVTMSVMEYLQSSRFSAIRDAFSFDMTLSGDHVLEMRSRYPDASVFSYGETEALGDGKAFLVRYIDASYDGALSIGIGTSDALLVPYSVFLRDSDGFMDLTMMAEGESGRMLPRTETYVISGAFYTPLGSAEDSSMLFLPYSMMREGIPIYTAIKGVDSSALDELRMEGYEGVSWKEKEAGLYSAFLIEKVMMYVVLSMLFVIILVSARNSVRVFFLSRRREIAELQVLGMENGKRLCVFLIAFGIIAVIGLASGFALAAMLLPAAELYMHAAFLVDAYLHLPVAAGLLYSAVLIAMIVLFALAEERSYGKMDLLEVIADESSGA